MANILVLNPNSGNAKAGDFWRDALGQAGVDVDMVESGESQTEDPATDDRLLIAGGDGTVRINAARGRRTRCELGVLPAGTGNDFARCLGIPLDPADACQTVADGAVRRVDAALVNDEVFLNVAHIGLGSDISLHTDSNDKSHWGRFAYLRTLFDRARQTRGFRAALDVDGKTIHGRWLQITVANGNSFGGGQQFIGADPYDGRLDVLGIRPRSLLKLFFIWLLARFRGSTPDSPAIVRLQARSIHVRGDRAMSITADGEKIAHLPATFKVDHLALRVVVPRQSTEQPTEQPTGQPTSQSDTEQASGE